MASLFEGKQLLTKSGLKPAAEVLKDKYVAIYFSAHWCPPCRGFTPQLAGVYEKVLKGKDLEIVFVSSDKDQAAFDEYYGEQPWVALPYADRDGKTQLSSKFKVSGIPSLIVLDKDGSILTKDGRGALGTDPQAAEFPEGWRPPKIADVLKSMTVIDQDGAKSTGAPATEYLILYFSAHWCPPCQRFTPKFAEVYKKLKAADKDVEVVFVSSDKDEKQFADYFASMPWKALAYDERKTKQQLSRLFEVSGIPSAIVLQRDGASYSVITDDAVQRIAADEAGEKFPYHPPLVYDAEEGLGPINELPVVVALAEHADEALQSKLDAALLGAAQLEKAQTTGGDARIGFISFKKGERAAHVGKILREKMSQGGCKLADDAAALAVIDVQGDRVLLYAKDALDAVSGEAVHTWMSTFLDGKADGVLDVAF